MSQSMGNLLIRRAHSNNRGLGYRSGECGPTPLYDLCLKGFGIPPVGLSITHYFCPHDGAQPDVRDLGQKGIELPLR